MHAISWWYYWIFVVSIKQVVIPLQQIRSVNPLTSKINPAEKYIQVVSVDNHEFWYMGFVNYDNAVKTLQEVVQSSNWPAFVPRTPGLGSFQWVVPLCCVLKIILCSADNTVSLFILYNFIVPYCWTVDNRQPYV